MAAPTVPGSQYYFETIFPRIPKPVGDDLSSRLAAAGLPSKTVGNAGQGGADRRGVEDGSRRPASVKVRAAVPGDVPRLRAEASVSHTHCTLMASNESSRSVDLISQIVHVANGYVFPCTKSMLHRMHQSMCPHANAVTGSMIPLMSCGVICIRGDFVPAEPEVFFCSCCAPGPSKQHDRGCSCLTIMRPLALAGAAHSPLRSDLASAAHGSLCPVMNQKISPLRPSQGGEGLAESLRYSRDPAACWSACRAVQAFSSCPGTSAGVAVGGVWAAGSQQGGRAGGGARPGVLHEGGRRHRPRPPP